MEIYNEGKNLIDKPIFIDFYATWWGPCKQCPHLLYDETNPDTGKKDGRCTHCGCFMNVKVHYAVAECPIDKWKKHCGCQCDCKHDGDCDERIN